MYLPCNWARYINYLTAERRVNRVGVRFPLEQLSNKYLHLELGPQRTLLIRTKFPRNRLASIVIASEDSKFQYDKSQSFVSSDGLKPTAITFPQVIQRCSYVRYPFLSNIYGFNQCFHHWTIIQQRILHWDSRLLSNDSGMINNVPIYPFHCRRCPQGTYRF